MAVTWQDPPATTRAGRRGSVNPSDIRELQANPGKWGMLKPCASKASGQVAASRIRHGRAPGFADGAWDARVGLLEDGDDDVFGLFVMFLGE